MQVFNYYGILGSLMFGMTVLFMGKKKAKNANVHTLAGIENGGFKNSEFENGLKGFPSLENHL